MASRGGRGRKRWAYTTALISGIVLLILIFGLFETARGDDEGGSSDDEVGDDGDKVGEEDDDHDDDDDFNDDFIRTHVVNIRQDDHNCRDDAYINCTSSKEHGGCSENDALGRRNLCPVTCGLCELPERTAVWVEIRCFEYGEDITVYFTNTSPEPDDYVGIFPAYINFDEEPEDLEDPYLWYTSCGGMNELCRTAMGGLIFGGIGPTKKTQWDDFPLAAGRYKAALVRGDERTLLAESQVFTATAEGVSCKSECLDLIYTDKSCYEFSDDIIYVAYENCSPMKNDRIAVYNDEEESPGETAPLLWLGTCGSRSCDDHTAVDAVEFPVHAAQSEAGGVLPPGNYRTFLMKTNVGGRYGRAFAKSSPFTVKAQGENCYIEEEDL